MTIKELKELLEGYIENLEENYQDDAEVEVVGNTYFLTCGRRFIATGAGFIDLDYPTGENESDEEEW